MRSRGVGYLLRIRAARKRHPVAPRFGSTRETEFRHVGAHDPCAAVRAGAAHLRADAGHDAFPRPRRCCAARRASKDIAMREPNWPQRGHAVRQLLQQPVRTAGPVLCADHPGRSSRGTPICCSCCWPGCSSRCACLQALVHVTSNDVRLRGGFYGVGRDRAADHVADLHRPHPARPAMMRSVMTPGARLAAAIEVLADIDARRRPARRRAEGLGPVAPLRRLRRPRRHRRPRLRRAAPAASAAFLMGEDTPARRGARHAAARARPRCRCDRAACRRLAPCAAAADRRRARAARRAGYLDGAPPHVRGDYPEWLDPHLARVFGEERAEEGAALASRAPLDLRVNTLKGERDEALAGARRS